MRCKLLEKMFKNLLMNKEGVEKQNFNKNNLLKDTFSYIFLNTWEWIKHIPIWNRPSDYYDYNLQFIAPKIILPKLAPMNQTYA
jgi:hypothetical protein